MKIEKQLGMKGEYQFIVNGEKATKNKNLITNIGLGKAGTSSFSFTSADPTYILLGTGTTPPTVNDSTMENKVTSKRGSNVRTYTESSGKKYMVTTLTSSFDVGQFVGTLSEVGCSTGNTTTATASRALLDTPIVLTATDQLTVVYVLTMEIPSFDDTTTINIFNTDTACRLVSVNKSIKIYASTEQLRTQGQYTIAIREDLSSVVKGQDFNRQDYVFDTCDVDGLTQNSTKTVVSGSITLTPTMANSGEGIYGIGFSGYNHGSVNNCTYLITFDIPIMKTTSDQIDITLNITLNYENV